MVLVCGVTSPEDGPIDVPVLGFDADPGSAQQSSEFLGHNNRPVPGAGLRHTERGRPPETDLVTPGVPNSG